MQHYATRRSCTNAMRCLALQQEATKRTPHCTAESSVGARRSSTKSISLCSGLSRCHPSCVHAAPNLWTKCSRPSARVHCASDAAGVAFASLGFASAGRVCSPPQSFPNQIQSWTSLRPTVANQRSKPIVYCAAPFVAVNNHSHITVPLMSC